MRPLDPEAKDKLVKKEMRKLKRLLAALPDNKRKAAEGLIGEAAFMRVTLEEARHIIDQDGVLEVFEQGSQRFLREHPATKVYNAMVQRYAAVCKQLFELLPDADQAKQAAEDELMAFVKRARR